MTEKESKKAKKRTGKLMSSVVVISIVLSVFAASVVPVIAPGPPLLDELILSADPPEMPADGVSYSTLTAVVYDADGDPYANAPVWFEIVSGNGTITDEYGDPNDGFVRGDPATATLTAGTTPGPVEIRAYTTSPNYPEDYTTVTLTEAPENGTVDGKITYTCNTTGIADVTVNLTEGSVVASTTTDSNGNYTFTDVTPGDYYVNASKPKIEGVTGFWDNSTDVTVTAGGTATGDMMLWLKGDLNNNCESADKEDVLMIFDAYMRITEKDKRHDLNENGVYADKEDVLMMFDAYMGLTILE